MKKTAFLLTFLLLTAALPAFAQSSEFGILFGGNKRMNVQDEADSGLVDDSFSFGNEVRELYYSVELEPATRFKLRVGQITGDISHLDHPTDTTTVVDAQRGDLQYAAGQIEYRFSEVYGTTGIFAGAGLYRAQTPDHDDMSDYGFQIGLNGDFPLSRRYGVVVEAGYHWVNLEQNNQFLTLTGGLRISF